MSAHTLNPYRAGLWTTGMARMLQALGLAMAGLVLTACERPSPESVQSGYRGTGMVQVYNPRLVSEQAKRNVVPAAQAPAAEGGVLGVFLFVLLLASSLAAALRANDAHVFHLAGFSVLLALCALGVRAGDAGRGRGKGRGRETSAHTRARARTHVIGLPAQ